MEVMLPAVAAALRDGSFQSQIATDQRNTRVAPAWMVHAASVHPEWQLHCTNIALQWQHPDLCWLEMCPFTPVFSFLSPPTKKKFLLRLIKRKIPLVISSSSNSAFC